MSSAFKILQKNMLPAEVVVLLLISMMMLVLGILLYPVYAGYLPYYEDGLFGLLIIVAALQILVLGKSPFGDVARTRFTVFFGILAAAFGIVVCFLPDIFGELPRLLLILFFGLGGAVQLVCLYRSRDEMRQRAASDPLLRRLPALSTCLYLFSVLLGVLLIFPHLLTGLLMCLTVLAYGIILFVFALYLRSVYQKYPPKEPAGCIHLSTGSVLLLLTGIFMVVLGLLLIPIVFGLLPFSPSAQLGLLLVLLSVQMMLLGETPLGAFPRTHLVVFIGAVLGVLGIICCFIPDVLLLTATVLIALGNICGGLLGLGRLAAMWKSVPAAEEKTPVSSLYFRLAVLMLIMNVLTILFGTSMLLPSLLPGVIIGIVLAANGFLLLALVYLLEKLNGLAASAAA